MTSPDFKRPRALLVLPLTFYSFAKVFAKELDRAGYDVTIANDEYPQSMLGRILGKLRLQFLIEPLTYRVLYPNFIAGQSYDVVLIIKGRGMSPRLLERMKEASKRVIAYNFDSFGYHPAPLAWYRIVHKFCTFDPADAAKYDLPLVPLFSSLAPNTNLKTVRYDISAIMRNHSQRLRYLDQVLRLVPSARVFVHVFEQNIFTFVGNFLKNPLLYMRYRKYIHFKSLPYDRYVDVLRGSEFTLDYAHPSQTGITIRCFEALSSQTKIVTNNPSVGTYPHFNESNTIVFSPRTDPDLLREAIARSRGVMPDKHHRSAATFMSELLS